MELLAPTLKTIRHTKERKEVHKVIAFCMAQRTHNCNVLQRQWASLMAQLVKNRPATWETWVRSLGWEDPLEKEPTSIFGPGEFHGLYSPWGLKELDTTERHSLSMLILSHVTPLQDFQQNQVECHFTDHSIFSLKSKAFKTNL